MRARLVVFPIKGRNWCFGRAVDPAAAASAEFSSPPPALKDVWKKLTAGGGSVRANAELVVDFVSDKMNRAWNKLEKAPAGTFKSKIHRVGLKLLSTVNPSEIFLKSVCKDTTKVDITYPASLNPRLVRRRLRHIAIRGSINHRRNFYGSLSMLPLTSAFAVLPLPNIPFFWVLFRTYSNWKALQGSERLLLLVSDCSKSWNLLIQDETKKSTIDLKHASVKTPWILQPSEELERLVENSKNEDGLSDCAVSKICQAYHLNMKHIVKYRHSL